MSPQAIINFKALYAIIKEKHQEKDTGLIHQMLWSGIVAGQCTQHIQFIQGAGIDAVLDSKAGKLRFNEGSAALLEDVLVRYIEILGTGPRPVKEQAAAVATVG